MSKADQLATALDDFLDVSPDVEAAAVVSADGLPMASALPPDVEEDRLAAMSAALLTLGERAASGLGKGDLAQVFVEGEHGHVVLMSAGENSVLVAVTSPGAKVGLVLFEMRRIASRVATVMNEPRPEEAASEVVTEPAEEPVEAEQPAPSWEQQPEPAAEQWQSPPQPPAPAPDWQPEPQTAPDDWQPEPIPTGESESSVSHWQ